MYAAAPALLPRKTSAKCLSAATDGQVGRCTLPAAPSLHRLRSVTLRFDFEPANERLAWVNALGLSGCMWLRCARAAQVDINVITFKGTTNLNSNVGLELYQNSRSALGFSGFLSSCNAALLVLGYSVETTVLVGTAQSTVLHYNTQCCGNQEYITVSISDQGNTGLSGVALTSSTVVPVTIVAVNVGPVIKVQVVEYDVIEDTLASLPGISISDVDINEQIQSTLASLDWLNKAEYQLLINAASIDLAVSKGVLFLSYTNNLYLLLTKEESFLSVKGWMSSDATADFCRPRDFTYLYRAPLGLGTDTLTLALPSGRSVSYHQVCYFANIGTDACANGKEAGCVCYVIDACDSTGEYTIPFNRSQPDYDEFQVALIDLMATLDLTCGGVPYQKWPNDFSFGKPCQSCASGTPCLDCGADALPKCTVYSQDPLRSKQMISNGTCRCCSDLSRGSSTDADCAGIPTPGCPSFVTSTLCGCRAGAPGNLVPPGKCGPYTFAPVPILSTDDPNYARLKAPCQITGYTPCTFVGAAASLCRSGMYAFNGTEESLIIEKLGIGKAGSMQVSMFGSIVDVNRLLQKISYQPDLYYNRRYRLPPDQQYQGYNIQSDDVDTLQVTVSDNGNSGGGLRDPLTAVSSVIVRVAAINDPPEIDAPTQVYATEDTLFEFQHFNINQSVCPDPNIRHAFAGILEYHCLPVQIADPDYLEYEFDTILFLLEMTTQHGLLFLNETFLEQSQYYSSPSAERAAGCRACTREIDLETCCACSPALPGCTLNFLSEGMAATGLYASPNPEYGVGNQNIRVIGSFVDLNLALSGLAYLGDSNFNTRYGLSESINITVSDYALIPTEPTWVKTKVNFIISVVVESVNDPPVIGRYLPETTYSSGLANVNYYFWPISTAINIADHCLTLKPTSEEYIQLCSVFPSYCPTIQCINGTVYRQYVDIDEDTVFVFDTT